jgi:nitroreductase
MERMEARVCIRRFKTLVLACRALGHGALITIILYEDEVRQILALPHDVSTFALMPIGYPLGQIWPTCPSSRLRGRLW